MNVIGIDETADAACALRTKNQGTETGVEWIYQLLQGGVVEIQE